MTNESEEILWEMAEQAWNECWPDEPDSRNKITYRSYLHTVFTRLIGSYDGPLSDIGYHLGEFSEQFIEQRSRAILEDAREAEAEARADAAEFDRDCWEDR